MIVVCALCGVPFKAPDVPIGLLILHYKKRKRHMDFKPIFDGRLKK